MIKCACFQPEHKERLLKCKKEKKIEHVYFNYELTTIKSTLEYRKQNHNVDRKKENTDWVAWTVGNSVPTEAVRLFSSIFPTRISITLFPLPLVLLCLFPAVSVEIVSWILLLLSYLCLFFNLQKASVETEKKKYYRAHNKAFLLFKIKVL